MKNIVIAAWIGVCAIVFLLDTQPVWAQGEGFITALATDSAAQQDTLPPGSNHQGGQVLHVVASKENLHLLAAYYYGDPRQWKRIYRENRDVIRNPRILTIGQTLRISVEENWRPAFSYQEWFRLATRNGEWVPGRWKRASVTPVRQHPPVAAETVPARAQEVTTPSTMPQDVSGTESSQPIEVPVEKTPEVEESAQAVEGSPEEKTSDDQQAPAF